MQFNPVYVNPTLPVYVPKIYTLNIFSFILQQQKFDWFKMLTAAVIQALQTSQKLAGDCN